MALPSRQVGWDQQTILLYEVEKAVDRLIKVVSNISGGSFSSVTGWKYYAITTADGVLDENTNVVTGTSTFALPNDCYITDTINKPMIVLNPGRVGYTLSGVNGAAFITFDEPPIAGDVPEIYYSVI